MGVGLRQALQVATLVLQVATLAPWEEGSVPAELGTQRGSGGSAGRGWGAGGARAGTPAGGARGPPRSPGACLPVTPAPLSP